MANQQVITIRLEFPSPDEVAALAQFIKRLGYDDCVRKASLFSSTRAAPRRTSCGPHSASFNAS